LLQKDRSAFGVSASADSAKSYHLFAHTADLGMEVRGKDLPDLFAQAGRAFFDIITGGRRIEPKTKRGIEVTAPDLEALLVAWLGELLFIFETRQLVFGNFIIKTLTPGTMQAIGQGERYDSKKHGLKQAIKAVTYHQLRLWEEKGIWRARVIFDL
jgi:SHS2 domain-containing protein